MLCRTPTVAIVGTRKPGPLGEGAVEAIVRQMSIDNVVISGMATGIDTFAHEAAIARGMATIAVLGYGINSAYSAVKEEMIKHIVVSGGLVLSEYPPSVACAPHLLMARNRVVAGLSAKLIAHEASMTRGIWAAAKESMRISRDVLAPDTGAPGNMLMLGTNLEDLPGELIQVFSKKMITESGSMPIAKELSLS